MALRNAKDRTFPVGFADLTVADIEDLHAMLTERARSVTIQVGDMRADEVADLRDAAARDVRRTWLMSHSPSISVRLNGAMAGVRTAGGGEEEVRLARDISDWLLAKHQNHGLRFSPLSVFLPLLGLLGLSTYAAITSQFADRGAFWIIGAMASALTLSLLFLPRQRRGFVRLIVDRDAHRQASRDWRRDGVLVLVSFAGAYVVSRLSR